MKRLLSFALAFVMVALMLPLSVIGVSAEANNANTLDLDTPYFMDFTTLTELPDGYVATTENNGNATYTIGAKGVTLLAVDSTQSLTFSGLMMPAAVSEGVAYTASVVFNVDPDAALDRIAFHWTPTVPSSTFNFDSGDATEKNRALSFRYRKRGDKVWDHGYGANYALFQGSEQYPEKITKDGQDITLAALQADANFKAAAMAGVDFKASFDIDFNHFLTALYIEYTYNGVTSVIKYIPPLQWKADGYFSVWSYGWATSKVNVKSISLVKSEKEQDVIVPDGEIDYTDAAETYYKDGYVLHHMDFAKVGNYKDTKYSFVAGTTMEKDVKIENGVLNIANNSDSAMYMMFTGNSIPKNITEYTANFKFRFVGDENTSFGFIRGISLKEDGTKNDAQTIELQFKRGQIYNGVPENEDAGDAIAAAMKAGEWVEVSISNVKRMVDIITVKCGDKTVTVLMDKNKAATAGYMGFYIGKETQVEVASVTILAGIAANATTPIWPDGITAGDLVQTVTNAAVATGTKPEYADPKVPGEDDANTSTSEPTEENTQPNDDTTTTAPTTGTPVDSKGCGSSVVAAPMVIVATIGCAAMICKKKKAD